MKPILRQCNLTACVRLDNMQFMQKNFNESSLNWSLIYGLNIFYWYQTSKELIQMDINKMMTNEIITVNDEHTPSEN